MFLIFFWKFCVPTNGWYSSGPSIYFLASNQDSKPDQISYPKVSYEIKYPTQNKVTKKNYDKPL